MFNRMMLNEDIVRGLVMAMQHPNPEWHYEYKEGKELDKDKKEVFFCRVFLHKPEAIVRIVDLMQVINQPLEFSATFREEMRQALVTSVFFAGLVLHERMHEEQQMIDSPEFVGAAKMRFLGEQIRKFIPGLEWNLCMWEVGKSGIANYISNADKKVSLQALEVLALRLKKDEIRPPISDQ